jgi:translation elongation factor EF-1beta
MDVKPWDDETDMKALEASVRAIEMDGLLWGTGKLVPVAYGVKKLQITCVIEDDKVNLAHSLYLFIHFLSLSPSLSLFRLVPNY